VKLVRRIRLTGSSANFLTSVPIHESKRVFRESIDSATGTEAYVGHTYRADRITGWRRVCEKTQALRF